MQPAGHRGGCRRRQHLRAQVSAAPKSVGAGATTGCAALRHATLVTAGLQHFSEYTCAHTPLRRRPPQGPGLRRLFRRLHRGQLRGLRAVWRQGGPAHRQARHHREGQGRARIPDWQNRHRHLQRGCHRRHPSACADDDRQHLLLPQHDGSEGVHPAQADRQGRRAALRERHGAAARHARLPAAPPREPVGVRGEGERRLEPAWVCLRVRAAASARRAANQPGTQSDGSHM